MQFIDRLGISRADFEGVGYLLRGEEQIPVSFRLVQLISGQVILGTRGHDIVMDDEGWQFHGTLSGDRTATVSVENMGQLSSNNRWTSGVVMNECIFGCNSARLIAPLYQALIERGMPAVADRVDFVLCNYFGRASAIQAAGLPIVVAPLVGRDEAERTFERVGGFFETHDGNVSGRVGERLLADCVDSLTTVLSLESGNLGSFYQLDFFVEGAILFTELRSRRTTRRARHPLDFRSVRWDCQEMLDRYLGLPEPEKPECAGGFIITSKRAVGIRLSRCVRCRQRALSMRSCQPSRVDMSRRKRRPRFPRRYGLNCSKPVASC